VEIMKRNGGYRKNMFLYIPTYFICSADYIAEDFGE